MRLFYPLMVLLLFMTSSTYSSKIMRLKPGSTYTITKKVDLRGASITIPDSVCLRFRGGSIENGTVLFNNTTLVGEVKVYTHIHPKSTITNSILDCSWFCPYINSGVRGQDASETINELINITLNYSDGQYNYTPTIYLPAGVYYCNNPINISTVVNGEDRGSRAISIKGEEGTKVVALNKMEYLFGRPLSESNSLFSGASLTLENITFDGNLRVDNTLNLSRISYSSIKNVKSIGGCISNLYMSYSFVNLFEHCLFKSWDVFRPTNIDVFLGPQEVNSVSFIGCVFEGANLGVYCGNGYVANFDGCVFEGLRRAAVYIFKTNQVNINGCYFEENSTTKNSKIRNDINWSCFGIKGFSIADKKIHKVEVHSDVVINGFKLEPADSLEEVQFTSNYSSVQSGFETVLGSVTLIGNSVQRINSCTNDNVYGYTVPNDAFIFQADNRPITAIGNNVVSIYADEINAEWHYSKNYQTPVYLKALYSGDINNKTATHLNNNISANTSLDKVMFVKVY